MSRRHPVKTQPLTADQLAAAALNFVAEFDPTRLPRTDLTHALTAFLMPLTHEGLKSKDVDCLVEAANSWFEAYRFAYEDALEDKPHAWAKHAAKDLRRVQVIAEAIVDGGRPE